MLSFRCRALDDLYMNASSRPANVNTPPTMAHRLVRSSPTDLHRMGKIIPLEKAEKS